MHPPALGPSADTGINPPDQTNPFTPSSEMPVEAVLGIRCDELAVAVFCGRLRRAQSAPERSAFRRTGVAEGPR